MNNTCLQCNEIIPEGRQVCPNCETLKLTCPTCGQAFTRTHGKQLYCSGKCRIKESNMRARERNGNPKKKYKVSDQLCWSCQNATGGCSWSKSLTPIKGWKAKKIEESYEIKKCPEYIKDDGKGAIAGDECAELATAIVMQGVNDYRKALKQLKDKPLDEEALKTKRECEQFFHSGWFTALTSINPEMLIAKINKEVEL